MTIDELRQAKNQRPFEPFRIRLADGHELPILHPDAVAWEDDTPRLPSWRARGKITGWRWG